MRIQSHIKALHDGVASDLERGYRRSEPIHVGEDDPTEALARLVMSWPARDVRLAMEYRASHKVQDTSDLYARDVASAVRVREERRVPGAGVLVVSLDFHSNMAEYERYNAVVAAHNKLWSEAGRPVDRIDPWTGDVSGVEGFVDYARAAEDIPPLGDGGGPLDDKRPSAVRSSYLTVEYRASESEDGWTLGFVCRDRAGKALCWNEESGPDLSALVRRATQMLYGHPQVVGDVGPLSDGLALLVQGRKSGLCASRNRRPGWMKGEVKHGPSAAYVEAKVEEVVSEGTHTVLGWWVPFIAIVAMVGWAIHCLNQTWGTPTGPHAGMGWFLAGEAVLCAALWVTAAIGTAARRHAEAMRMTERYL
jgi:hypothetical protein